MSTEHYPYLPYHPLSQQPSAQGGQSGQGGHYPAGAYAATPAQVAYYAQSQWAMPPGAYPGAYQSQQSSPFFNISNDRFLKGLLIGAAATYLLTNESVQRTMIKGAVKAWSFVRGGVEEIKERFHDAEAELHAAEAEKEESEAAKES